MMTTETKLVNAVAERLSMDVRVSDSSIFTPEIREALRLSDLYAIEKPKEYVLPLNAMAGFRRTP
jgi:myo-inositol-1-phosphate synthase